MSSEIISVLKKDHIRSLLIEGRRSDGRGFEEMRPISVKTHVIDKAEGSAYVQYGDTKVLVGIKLQKGAPFSDSPGEGVIMTGMEMNPVASPEFEPGPPKEDAIEMARIVDRGIRESHAIDLEKLCVKHGEIVWMVFIDISVLNDAGNIVDASALGAMAALMTTVIPADDENGFAACPMPIRDTPVCVTVASVCGELILDPSLDEESVCDTKLSVITNRAGALSGMQKSGSGPLPVETVRRMVDLGRDKACELRERYLTDISLEL